MAVKSSVRDMTEGSIAGHLLAFSVPLFVGNLFQMLYNMVDSLVVGNFVGTQALAAVGSTTAIVNMLVFFFNGMSTGASVLIGQTFGAHDEKRMHIAVETTMAMTFMFSIIFTVIGVAGVPYMLRFMSTPEDVMGPASLYLRIYFAGISGLLIYNMGSGILRAVGDSVKPLLFLVFTSVVNTVLDLLFVLVFHMGIAGAAIATIISQFISAVLILVLLTGTKEIYRFSFREMALDSRSFQMILTYGFPAALQSTITAFSNVFVQSYINVFGSSCMAGWSCFNRIEQLVYMPMQSVAVGATSFVSQNIGANKKKRADKGTVVSLILVEAVTLVLTVLILLFAEFFAGAFTKDPSVIEFGVLFLRVNGIFLSFNCINHTLAGALRGRGDSLGPMIIMLISFVAIRQTYLFVAVHYFVNSPLVVGLGFPVGWVSCCIIEVIYFLWGRSPLRRR